MRPCPFCEKKVAPISVSVRGRYEVMFEPVQNLRDRGHGVSRAREADKQKKGAKLTIIIFSSETPKLSKK